MKRALFDYYLRCQGKRKVPLVSRVLNASLEQMQEYQKKRLRFLVVDAYENCPFYRKLYDEAGVNVYTLFTFDDFKKLPIINKNHLRLYRNDLIHTLMRGSKKLIPFATGGTTSSPIPLCIEPEAVSIRRATKLFFYGWYGLSYKDRIAYLWGAEHNINGIVQVERELTCLRLSKKMTLPASYLSHEKMALFYAYLSRFKPHGMQAYPSALYIFARYLKEKRLSLHIPAIYCMAEKVYDYQRELIEEVFHTRIFDLYAAREVGHIGSECSMHAGLHINMHGVYLELVQSSAENLNGQGRFIVSNLVNRAMPLIRYDLGDVGTFTDDPCPCGSHMPLLTDVVGRHADIFKKEDGTLIPGISLNNRIIKECRGVEQIQIIQHDYDTFEIVIVKGPFYSARDIRNIKDIMSRYFHKELAITVSHRDAIEAEPSGKQRLCKCEIHDDVSVL